MKKLLPLFLCILLLFGGCTLTVERVDNSEIASASEEAVSEKTEETCTEKLAEAEITFVQTTADEKTEAETKAEASEVVTEKVNVCTFYVECKTILDNSENMKADKKEFLPADGVILKETAVTFRDGETVFDVLKRVCKANGIQMESSYTPGYDNYYIEGINQIYEKDCGTKSGWMYSVNGDFPNYGCSDYVLKDGDRVEWRYTCDLGEDIGDNSFLK